MTLTRISLVMALTALVAGCSAATAPGSMYLLTEARPWGPTMVQWLAPCSPNPSVGTIQCNATLTGKADDEEAWMFEARIRMVSNIGVPYGREPRDYFVVGDRDHCDVVRGALRSKPHAFYAQETPPTDPCHGPFYFKRMPNGTGPAK